jgi:hypothetical protein
MKVVLTRKLADSMDGVDVSAHEVGDALELPAPQADLLIAEGWVVIDRRSQPPVATAVERRQLRRAIAPATLEQHLNRAS